MNGLKRQRQLLSLTQHQLARAARISPWKIAYAESGRMELSSKEVQKVKVALARRTQHIAAALATADDAQETIASGSAAAEK